MRQHRNFSFQLVLLSSLLPLLPAPFRLLDSIFKLPNGAIFTQGNMNISVFTTALKQKPDYNGDIRLSRDMFTLILVLLSSTNVIAVLLNVIVIYTFLKIRRQLTFKDHLILGMAISDFFQCVIGYPLEIYSSQQGHWSFSLTACKV